MLLLNLIKLIYLNILDQTSENELGSSQCNMPSRDRAAHLNHTRMIPSNLPEEKGMQSDMLRQMSFNHLEKSSESLASQLFPQHKVKNILIL